MYKFKSYLMSMLAMASVAFMTSCGGDSTPNPKAEIVFTPSATTDTLMAGDVVNLQVSVTSQDNLKSFKAERFILGNGDLLSSTTSFPGAGYSYTLQDTIPFDAQPGNTVEYRFTAVTKNNETTTKSFTVTVGGAANTYNGVLYNIAGPEKGAYDLVANTGLSSSAAAANKDMVNTTPTSGANAAVFEASWTAGTGNGTMFVQAPNGFFESANSSTTQATYSAGTPSQSVNDVAVGDVYIAKLRGGSTYAVIKITEVVDDNMVGTNKNNDRIGFLYKKF